MPKPVEFIWMTTNRVRRSNALSLLTRLWHWVVEQPARSREPLYRLPALMEDRGLILKWLFTARAAQITLVLCFAIGLLIMPSARDVLLKAIYPPVTKTRFLGIGKRVYQNPKLKGARKAFNTIYWLGSTTAVVWLLWVHIPTAVAQVGAVRRKRGGNKYLPEDPFDGSITRVADGAVATAPTILSHDAQLAATILEDSPGESPKLDANEGQGGHREAGLSPSGRYQIQRELGRGGMGVVYLASDTSLGRTVALKELSPNLMSNQQLVQRFRQEARVLARLSHPHIVQIYDLVESDERMWMAMEYVSGGSLDELLLKQNGLPVTEVIRIGTQMAQAIAYAHRQGVIHRDFKPANVLISQEKNIKVSDFGIAKLIQGPKLTQTGTVLGSPSYMSPEQATGGSVDIQSDVYSFGATLYEMLTGQPPFTGDTVSVLTQLITQPVRPPSQLKAEIPSPFDRLILAAMQKKPEDRIPDMDEVLEKLAEITHP